ncbi:hypothetical protein PoB_002560400 [Plakobranchus ocellatus]|uniref:Uncharacterized protein n=1 Tax=Plakobranchus ocellatus TaxID=259542 RepID=A0AAV3ZYS5_9GAST|nr:hypothetical protein PoB_002560400 [Plakobranchus ocellatus]
MFSMAAETLARLILDHYLCWKQELESTEVYTPEIRGFVSHDSRQRALCYLADKNTGAAFISANTQRFPSPPPGSLSAGGRETRAGENICASEGKLEKF